MKCGPFEALLSIQAWKKFGSPNCYGGAVFGFSYFGYQNEWAGIYRRRPHKNGVSIVKMAHYCPIYKRTVDQALQRDKFQDAIHAWQALSPEEQEALRKIASRKSKRAYNVFLTQYLKTH